MCYVDFLKTKQALETDKRLICFGTGRIFAKFMDRLQKMINCTVAYAVDNDETKWGTEIPIPSGKCKIYPPSRLKGNIDSYILIITCADANPIKQQIKSMGLDIEAYSYAEFIESYHVWCASEAKLPASFREAAIPLIPQTIHYCWFGGGAIPDQYKEWMQSWKKFCPDYEIVEWNENNYDVHKNQYISDAYKAKKWAFVSDYARLDIIYENGGIYLDTDVELVKNLDELLYAKGFMAFELDHWVATGLGFGAVEHLPIIKEMRDVYDDVGFVDFVDPQDFLEKYRAGQVKYCTDYQTGVLSKYGLERDSFKFQQVADLQIYPVPVLCGLVGSQLVLGDNTYSIHHYAASWIE